VGVDAGPLLANIAVALHPEAAELSSLLIRQMLSDIPDLSGDQAILEMLTASVNENVANILRRLDLGGDTEDIRPPPAALEYARRLAQRGIPISALVRAYRLGHYGFQHRVMTEVAAAGVPAELIAAAAMQLAAVTFEYIDRVSEEVVATYQREREAWLRNRVAARSAQVTAILASTAVDVVETEKVLNYRLGQAHVGLIVWSDDLAPSADRLSRLERAAQRVGEAAGCSRPPLLVAADAATLSAWLPSPTVRLNSTSAARVVGGDPTVWVAAGKPADGLAGFRLTHRQARQARDVAMATVGPDRPRVTLSADVGAIALMCADRDATAAWVQETLGDLALDDEPSARLRETLWAFLAAGGSFTAAARELTMHKNTVQYRIRKADEARRRPVQDDRLDVEVALLACRTLGSAVLRPSQTVNSGAVVPPAQHRTRAWSSRTVAAGGAQT
jgi:hypothetical protein